MRLRKVIASIALVAALVTTGLGIAVGLFVLLAPTQVRCELPALQPGIGITGSGNCVRVNIFEMGESIWPLPIIPIVVWSLAPALSLFGVLRIRGRKRGFAVVVGALLVEATAIISFVAGPMFLLYVFVPLAVTTLLASIAAAPRLRRPATGSRIEPLSSGAVVVAEKTEKPARRPSR